jgi:hypothetical protein
MTVRYNGWSLLEQGSSRFITSHLDLALSIRKEVQLAKDKKDF